MCRLCGWFEAKLCPQCAAYRRALRQKLQLWRYTQTNDQEVIDRDPEHDALVETERMWRRDPEAAFPELAALAERGSVWSMLLLGYAYQVGKGVTADPLQAESWYRRASEHGCRQAQLRLGWIYDQRNDDAKSELIYAVGAAEHWAPAMYYLARVKLRQPTSAEQLGQVRALLEQASALGDLGAQIELAHLFVRGRFGWQRIPSGIRLVLVAAKKVFALEKATASATQSNGVPGVSFT
jgi:uncharacterized protein